MKYHSHLRVEADVTPDVFWNSIVDILGFSKGMTGIYGFMDIKLLDDEPRSGSLIEITGNKGSLSPARLDRWDPERRTCEMSVLQSDHTPAVTWKFRAGRCAQVVGRSFVELDIINEVIDLSWWGERVFGSSEKLKDHNLARDFFWSFQQRIGNANLVTTEVKRL